VDRIFRGIAARLRRVFGSQAAGQKESKMRSAARGAATAIAVFKKISTFHKFSFMFGVSIPHLSIVEVFNRKTTRR